MRDEPARALEELLIFVTEGVRPFALGIKHSKDLSVLEKHGFPLGRVLAREAGETYGDIAEREMPDVLIEDSCESIGGAAEMTSSQIGPDPRSRIKVIVVPEFGGIDHLPDSLEALLRFES